MIKKLSTDVFYGPLDEVRMAQKINEIIDLLEEKFPEEVEPKLLPCPFCGGEAEVSSVSGSVDTMYTVGCIGENCKAGPIVTSFDSEEAAIAIWNTRAEVKR